MRMSTPHTAAGDFTICQLCEIPSLAPVLAAAHTREWGHLYANWNEKVALADFQSETANSAIPATWVIHDRSDTPMGSISLVMDDLPGHPDLNPWLANLYVFPDFRGRGRGRILVEKALETVRQHQIPNVYLFTEDQVPFFSRFDFTIHGPAQANGHAVTLMKWTDPQASLPSGREN